MKRIWAFFNTNHGGFIGLMLLMLVFCLLAPWGPFAALVVGTVELLVAIAEFVAPNILWFLLAWTAFIAISVYLINAGSSRWGDDR